MPKTKKQTVEPVTFTRECTNFLWASYYPEQPCQLHSVALEVENSSDFDPELEYKVLNGTTVLCTEVGADKVTKGKAKLYPGVVLAIGVSYKKELQKGQTVKVAPVLEIEVK